MKKIVILISTIALASCSMMPSYNKKNQVAYVENDNVSVQLAVAAKKASDAIVELAEVEKMRTPTTSAPVMNNIPRLLRQKMSINWNGPIKQIVQKIADRAMYDVVEMGKPYSTPILVQIDAVDAPIIDILRNVGLQAGSRANLVVDTENRNLEVHYVEIQETF
ncbi:MAG: DotD/TraH family lipoprotein [Alphaproteobacteria bacterium]|jgi:defect-in-organelle-trafficking protein DotD|nr:DotD/TraH family lipoprotein [Alphaproteobacteria bacterium]MCV6599420.1 DotD/TraH family lipoprotein [Alphaproteobacteria bacterium]